MGFFDSFKKKEDLPPPPPPQSILNQSNPINNPSTNTINNQKNNQLSTNTPFFQSRSDNTENNIINSNNMNNQSIYNSNINSNNNLTNIVNNLSKNPDLNINNNNINNSNINNNNNQIPPPTLPESNDNDIKTEENINKNLDTEKTKLDNPNKPLISENKDIKNDNLIIPEKLPEMPKIKLPELNIKKKEFNEEIINNKIPLFKTKEDIILNEQEIPLFKDINEQEILKNNDLFSEKIIEKINNNYDKEFNLPLIKVFDFEEPNSNILYGVNTTQKFQNKPLFIRTDHYSNILSTIDSIKEYTTNSPNIIYSLENLKKNQDIEHKRFKNCLEDIQRKIIYIDKHLFERD